MKILECDRCGLEVKASTDAVAILCSYCISDLLVETLPITPKKKVGYPKGWRFMKEFVHTDGTVYHKGVEQPSLKGTLSPTPIVEKPKVSKKQREQEKISLMDEYTSLKKKLKTEKRKTTRKKLEARLTKISKLL